jgi:VanZ family protein
MEEAVRRRVQLWAPVAIYMALIFGISSISSPPDLSTSIGDKGAHAILYSGLAALLVRALAGGWWRSFGVRIAAGAITLSTLYGVTDEIHQIFVPPRTAELADLAADAIGSVAAVVVLYAAHTIWSRLGR